LCFVGFYFSSAVLFVLESVPWTWQRAYSAAQKDLALELTDCWFDLIPAVLSEEWNVCRKGNYSISSSLSAGDPKGLHYWIPILDFWFAGFIIPVHFFQQYH
jgi:hypothetical protein